ncbi:MAG: hypothetical protein WC806_06320 [Candidatus Gracilibacteria bacterium]|jgi:hypothetical protein
MEKTPKTEKILSKKIQRKEEREDVLKTIEALMWAAREESRTACIIKSYASEEEVANNANKEGDMDPIQQLSILIKDIEARCGLNEADVLTIQDEIAGAVRNIRVKHMADDHEGSHGHRPPMC